MKQNKVKYLRYSYVGYLYKENRISFNVKVPFYSSQALLVFMKYQYEGKGNIRPVHSVGSVVNYFIKIVNRRTYIATVMPQ
ncbi:hypothetical protein K1719_012713 [Acacia pycnantha]|nr:hypothetical protein K1719_012713 [Acacia pycnantha]